MLRAVTRPTAALPRLLLLLALLLVAFAAGCGGEDEAAESTPAETQPAPAGEPGSAPEGAALVPASAVLMISLDGDFGSEQWLTVQELIGRFPGGQELVDSGLADLAEEGVDFEADVRPALGSEVDIAFLDLPLDTASSVEGCLEGAQSGDLGDLPAECAPSEPAEAKFVLLTKPADPAKLDALLAKVAAQSDEPPARRDVEGWVLLAPTDAIIDEALAGRAQGSLADAPGFAEAMEELPGDAVAKLYVNGAPITAMLEQAITSDPQSAANPILGQLAGLGGLDLQSVALSLLASADGVRLDGVARTGGATAPAPFRTTLHGVAPDGALAFVSFANIRAPIEQLLEAIGQSQPEVDAQLGQIETFLGISIEQDLLPLLEGEHALYVRPGLPIPEVTLLLSPADPTAAVATLDKVVGAAGAIVAVQGGSETPFASKQTQIGDVTARQLDFTGEVPVSVFYAAVGDNLVVTTSVAGIADLQTGGRLADDPAFQHALEVGDVPAEASGLVFVDFPKVLNLLRALPLENVDEDGQKALDALGALGSLVFYATGEPGVSRVSGFLEITGVAEPAAG
jgi:hypothetical protein